MKSKPKIENKKATKPSRAATSKKPGNKAPASVGNVDHGSSGSPPPPVGKNSKSTPGVPFSTAKADFDLANEGKQQFRAFLPVHQSIDKDCAIRNHSGEPLEEYYKWQLLYCLLATGKYAKDYLGVEVHFPKGNVGSQALKVDAAIFDDKDWFQHYVRFWTKKEQAALDWLRTHLVAVIEFKREDSKNLEAVYNQQLKPAIKESERGFCMGVIYDKERLYLFRKHGNKCLRLSDDYNTKGETSAIGDLSLHLTDPYANLPPFDDICNWNVPTSIDRSKRTIADLATISSIHSTQITDAMSSALRQMDKQGMVNQKGYEILVQVLALKIFDEKRNEKTPTATLKFYIESDERNFATLDEQGIQRFIKRMKRLREDAEQQYHRILYGSPLDLQNDNHVRVLIEIVTQFQDYSFVRSQKTDLYQLVFYRFATPLSKDQNAQFVTPLPLIDFLVSVVNPRNEETVLDPTVGIADFLSVAYVNSNSRLSDNNIYGIDIDEQMVMLATLNMLLNGDGNAKLLAKPGYGSLLSKFEIAGNLVELVPSLNSNGEWYQRADSKKLKRFNVVLTNPPFGDDRAFRVKEARDKEVIECYELWHKARCSDFIDLGLIFLENAYRVLAENGRLGIVLSNSIASIDRWEKAREWLLEKMRLVAAFDLPANVFAETGVSTTMIVAYRPSDSELAKLKEQSYRVFIKDIKSVGYEVVTSKRVKRFRPIYRKDPKDFSVQIDNEGRPVLDEDFSQTLHDFRAWCATQEETLQYLFTRSR